MIPDLIAAFEGKTTAGALSIGPGAADACLEILSHCQGNNFIAMATYPMPQKPLKSFVLLQTILGYLSWNVAHWFKCKAKGIRSQSIFATTLADNGVRKMVFEGFLPKALEEGTFRVRLLRVRSRWSWGGGWSLCRRGLMFRRRECLRRWLFLCNLDMRM